jgi:hypothetical protein
VQKGKLIYCLLLWCLIFVSGDLMAQGKYATKKKRKTPKKELKEDNLRPWQDQVSGDLRIGNFNFFNGLFISTKLAGAYKFNDRFSAGLGGKLFYTQFVLPGIPDETYVDKGGYAFFRGKITKTIYLQAEYHATSYTYVSPALPGETVYYPALGGGYLSGDRWKFGFELNYLISERAREYQNAVLEYWFGVTYNF